MTKFQLTPKTGYVVSAAVDFINNNDQTFVDYYLPLMSPNALGLFSALKYQLKGQPLLSERQPVSHLLTQLNTGIRSVNEALTQLEAVGLIKTFSRSDELGVVAVFELHPTLTPAAFMKDDLLSVQLLEMVGSDQFKRLGKAAVARYLNIDHLENVSHSFFEVFHPNRDQSSTDEVLQETQNQIKQATNQRVPTNSIPQDAFDLHFVAQQLSGAGIDPEIVNQYRRLILVEHLTYGYDELAIARLIERSVDVVDDQFNEEEFKKRARNAGHVQKQPINNQKVDKIAMAGLSEQVQSLIQLCESQAPMEFLTQLKQQTNGYVSSSERYTVERLVQQSGLSNGAINILLWYIIGEQGLATVKANLADAIANNWSRSGVTNSLEAFNEIKQHKAARLQRQKNGRPFFRNGRKKNVQEKLPDWAKKDYQPKAKSASPEQLAESKRLLAELRKNRNKQDQGNGGEH
ncbi:DnaD domain protein [uncultured Limosilactobacillus sp.]|uniref:DnaD domain protein n=1 Tax=uncultured Limosilactobacillus sp. TaxID=2837629 RepID=UPI0025F8AA92|nr:DnaD domain protein [uncultured Limosilactobacillus sp.]